MTILAKRKTTTDELRGAALAALVSALDGQSEKKDKRGLTGPRALAAGAVIYTAGRAAFSNRHLVREQLTASRHDDEDLDENVEGDDPEPEEGAEATGEDEDEDDPS